MDCDLHYHVCRDLQEKRAKAVKRMEGGRSAVLRRRELGPAVHFGTDLPRGDVPSQDSADSCTIDAGLFQYISDI